MIRSYCKGALLAAAASAGVAWGQSAPMPATVAAPAEQVVTIREKDGVAEPCLILKTWMTPQGKAAYLLQCVDTQEKITVVQNAASRAGATDVGVSIYRWGNWDRPPHGSPVPPADEEIRQVGHSEAPPARRPHGLARFFSPSAPSPAPAPAPVYAIEAPPRRPLGLSRILHPSAPEPVVEPAPGGGVVYVTEAPPRRPLGLSRVLPVSATEPAPAPVVETVPAGCDNGHCGYVHRYERPALIHFAPGNCLPVHTPTGAPDYGYHPTQWHPWPGAASPSPEQTAVHPLDVPPPKVVPAVHREGATGPALNP
jgi:hypothetical protein